MDIDRLVWIEIKDFVYKLRENNNIMCKMFMPVLKMGQIYNNVC